MKELSEKEISIASHFSEIMTLLGVKFHPGVDMTPVRFAKMMSRELCGSLISELPDMTTFENPGNDQMVLVRDIKVHSLCEHHFLPFIGKAHVAYIPGQRIIGLSKIPRLVDYYSRMPQVQENLTQQIGNSLVDILSTPHVAVIIEAKHLCYIIRGVKDENSSTITSYLGGNFRDTAVREEFMNLIKM